MQTIVRASVVIVVLVLAAFTVPTSQEASAAKSCQCVEYVKNELGLTGNAGNAKDMGTFLSKNGFTKVSTPVKGAVVIFRPPHQYVDPTYGHVGIVREVKTEYGKWKLLVRSSNLFNQKYFSDAGCSNVSDTWFTPYSKTATTVTYWVKK
jgi:surface antigen